MDLGLNSAVNHDASYDSFFIASELGASTPWLVGLVKEPGCKVLDPGPRVQRVLTRSDCKVGKRTQSLLLKRKGHRDSQEPAPLRDLSCCMVSHDGARSVPGESDTSPCASAFLQHIDAIGAWVGTQHHPRACQFSGECGAFGSERERWPT